MNNPHNTNKPVGMSLPTPNSHVKKGHTTTSANVLSAKTPRRPKKSAK